MPRPGTEIVIGEATPVRGAILDTGQAFFVGFAGRARVDKAVEVHSLREYERRCGVRTSAPTMHDSVRAFFTEGGGTVYIGRLVATDAVAASNTDTWDVPLGEEGETLPPVSVTVTATSPGLWGNSIVFAIVPVGYQFMQALSANELGKAAKARGGGNARAKADEKENAKGAEESGTKPKAATQQAQAPAPRAGLFQVMVLEFEPTSEAFTTLERSPGMTTWGEVQAWSARSDFVRVSAADANAQLVAGIPRILANGSDGDPSTIGEEQVAQTLERSFPYSLGPGQVAYPGGFVTDVTPWVGQVLLAHCEATRRCALLDLRPDEPYAVEGLYGKVGVRFGQALAPQIVYPGPGGAAVPVNVPYSAVQAGIIARQDRLTGNPNQPAAGINGVSRQALDITHDWSDEQREDINEAGTTLAKVRYGEVRTYGSRTAAGPGEPLWQWFGGSRVVMAIAHEADAVAEQYVHRQIDARRHIFIELGAELTTVCMKYFSLDALWGETPEEAFVVDTDSPNTPETINAGEIHAVIGLKTSPSSEFVRIELVKHRIDAALAAAA